MHNTVRTVRLRGTETSNVPFGQEPRLFGRMLPYSSKGDRGEKPINTEKNMQNCGLFSSPLDYAFLWVLMVLYNVQPDAQPYARAPTQEARYP